MRSLLRRHRWWRPRTGRRRPAIATLGIRLHVLPYVPLECLHVIRIRGNDRWDGRRRLGENIRVEIACWLGVEEKRCIGWRFS